MSTSLLILAYNEEVTIENVIKNYATHFDNLIVINDASTDNTRKLLSDIELDIKNLIVVNNKINLGAGKSFEIGVNKFLELNSENLVKIDGDNQFNFKDVIKIKKLLEETDYSFIKCDRFWAGGIVGKIPNIRYFGNSIASFLIKFSTGIWKINDPLNGLYGIKKTALLQFKLPKLFYRYGYPFYLCNYFSFLGFTENLKIAQIQNTVKYENEVSNLNPFIMLMKLPYFVIKNFYNKINLKNKFSKLQISGLLDLTSQIFLFLTFYSIFKFMNIRYFNAVGPQSSWFILFILFFILFVVLIIASQNRLNKLSEKFFHDIDL